MKNTSVSIITVTKKATNGKKRNSPPRNPFSDRVKKLLTRKRKKNNNVANNNKHLQSRKNVYKNKNKKINFSVPNTHMIFFDHHPE